MPQLITYIDAVTRAVVKAGRTIGFSVECDCLGAMSGRKNRDSPVITCVNQTVIDE